MTEGERQQVRIRRAAYARLAARIEAIDVNTAALLNTEQHDLGGPRPDDDELQTLIEAQHRLAHVIELCYARHLAQLEDAS